MERDINTIATTQDFTLHFNTKTANVARPDNGIKEKALILVSPSIPFSVVSTNTLNLKTDTTYVVEFDYWTDEVGGYCYAGLFPDELPSRFWLTPTRELQRERIEIRSSNPKMAECILRFVTFERSGTVFVSNVMFYEKGAEIGTTQGLRGSDSTNPFRFNGEYWDGEIGFSGEYNLRARSYCPRVGRFGQPDPYWNAFNSTGSPLAIMQASNLYMFCGHNPIKYHDPTGLYQVMLRYVSRSDKGDFSFDRGHGGQVSVTVNGVTRSTSYQMIGGQMTVDSNWLTNSFSSLSQSQVTHQAGDLFHSPETAALAFSLMFNTPSRSFRRCDEFPNGREYMANIYRTNHFMFPRGRAMYTFGVVVAGDAESVPVPPINRELGTLVAQVHTHGAYTYGCPGYNMFSFDDTDRSSVDQFVATPSGHLLRKDFIEEREFGRLLRWNQNVFSDTIEICDNLPYDTRENYNRWHRPHLFNRPAW